MFVGDQRHKGQWELLVPSIAICLRTKTFFPIGKNPTNFNFILVLYPIFILAFCTEFITRITKHEKSPHFLSLLISTAHLYQKLWLKFLSHVRAKSMYNQRCIICLGREKNMAYMKFVISCYTRFIHAKLLQCD